MLNYIYKDMRTQAFVRIEKIRGNTALVVRLKDRHRYLTDMDNLKRVYRKED